MPHRAEQNSSYMCPHYPIAEDILAEIAQSGAEIERAQKQQSCLPLSPEEIKQLANELASAALAEMETLDGAAANQKLILTQETIDKTALIVCFSKPGTYDKVFKKDKYRDFPWSWGMDRYGADAAAFLGIHIAATKTNQVFAGFYSNPSQRSYKYLEPWRNVIGASIDSNIRFLYSGRAADLRSGTPNDETAAIRKVLNSDQAFIPESAVDIRETGISDTYSQVVDLKQYLEENYQKGLIKPGSRIVLVSFTPQAVRILRMCAQVKPLPEKVELSVLPLPTPKAGLYEYPFIETKGIIFYTLTQRAALQSIPYTLLGAEDE